MSKSNHWGPVVALALLSIGFAPRTTSAQDTTTVELPEVRIQAARGSFSSDSAPVAVAVLRRDDAQRTTEPALAVENVLTELPGIWVADRSHLAIGERVVIRGLGSRAAFGVRSVAVLLDGVLLTMPDGQAVLDAIEPASIRRAELIRGPASRFWGNAAGGVLSLETGRQEGATIRGLAGSLGEQQVMASAAINRGRLRMTTYGSWLDRSGYRDHAAGSMGRFGVRGSKALSTGQVIAGSFHVSQLDTESPGSLTLEQFEAEPTAADQRYISTSSGKEATQFQGALGLTSNLGGGVFSLTAFGVSRSLDNPLPFAWIGLERQAVGVRADWRRTDQAVSWGLGADARRQQDDRINTENAGGARGTSLRLDQREVVTGIGGSLVADITAGRAIVSAGTRLDALTVSMDDNLVSNGDQSGEEQFLAFSPSLGVVVHAGQGTVHASFSTAFEIPTTTELVNRPDGLGGFNEDLKPQRISGFEAGARQEIGAGRLELAAYYQTLTNFLSPYQLEQFEGRTFYRNVGRVNYAGVEASWSASLTKQLSLNGTAAVHSYRFADGDNKDNTVPGVPSRFGSLRLAWTGTEAVASLRLRAAGSQKANDGNSTEIDGFVVADLRVGGTGFTTGSANIQPFVEISNVLDRAYAASVIPNARGGRYYEGGPGRAIRGGLALSF